MRAWYRLYGGVTMPPLAAVLEMHTGTWHFLVSRDKQRILLGLSMLAATVLGLRAGGTGGAFLNSCWVGAVCPP